jgi:hypothetical protein
VVLFVACSKLFVDHVDARFHADHIIFATLVKSAGVLTGRRLFPAEFPTQCKECFYKRKPVTKVWLKLCVRCGESFEGAGTTCPLCSLPTVARLLSQWTCQNVVFLIMEYMKPRFAACGECNNGWHESRDAVEIKGHV